MDVNFVEIGDENFVNLMNVARVRFSEGGAEIFYIGGQSESIAGPTAIGNLRRAIGADVADRSRTVNKGFEQRKAMEVAQTAPGLKRVDSSR